MVQPSTCIDLDSGSGVAFPCIGVINFCSVVGETKLRIATQMLEGGTRSGLPDSLELYMGLGVAPAQPQPLFPTRVNLASPKLLLYFDLWIIVLFCLI